MITKEKDMAKKSETVIERTPFGVIRKHATGYSLTGKGGRREYKTLYGARMALAKRSK